MDSQKQSIIDRIKQANNILVTVSSDPSVDQLSACIGLTLMLNELDKHATAVFSGAVPSTIEFLQPEKTIEKNTDSLRDFIIALDKSKADKLRYKVEDKVVKIFITPYRTSISDKDLEFSQGDFNVDVVVCLGVRDQRDLDQAITSHGRILHDATVVSINTTAEGGTLGTLNWQNPQASSLSEMVASLSEGLGKNLLDTQIATALLTGVVAETDRFSNSKTSPETMKASALLMAAGANQQLVATKLAEPPPPPPEPLHEEEPPEKHDDDEPPAPPKNNDGTLRIEHTHDEVSLPPVEAPPAPAPEPAEPKEEPQIHIDESGHLQRLGGDDREFLAGPGPDNQSVSPTDDAEDERPSGAPPEPSKFVLTPPTLGGTLTANSRPEGLEPTTDPLTQASAGSQQPILTHNSSSASAAPESPRPPKVIQPPAPTDETGAKPALTVPAPAVAPTPSPDAGNARGAVTDAINQAPETEFPKPRTDLSAQPLGSELHEPAASAPKPAEPAAPKEAPPEKPTEPLGGLVEPLPSSQPVNEPAPAADSPSAKPLDMPLPPTLTPSPANTTPPTSSSNDSPQGPPPPVPPPFMPQPIEPTGQ